MKTFAWVLASVASLSFVACAPNDVGPTDGTTGGGAGAGSGTTTGGVPVTCSAVDDYPKPGNGVVCGIGVNDIFPDVVMNGGAITNFSPTPTLDCGPKPSGTSVKNCASSSKDCCTQNAPNFVNEFAFHDLYNQGKPLSAGGAGMRYAFIDISGAWCLHCKDEAATLPGNYVSKWLGQGGVVFSILVQDANSSAPCTLDTFFQWINNYQINYPMSIDSEENLALTTSLKAWPGNLIIRLSDMHVMATVLGADDQFYKTFSDQLTRCTGDATNPNDCYAGSTCQSGTCVAN